MNPVHSLSPVTFHGVLAYAISEDGIHSGQGHYASLSSWNSRSKGETEVNESVGAGVQLGVCVSLTSLGKVPLDAEPREAVRVASAKVQGQEMVKGTWCDLF